MKLAVLASLAVGVAANQATPLSKVTQLLTDLIKENEEKRDAEKAIYDKYSCFCKDTTKEKSDSILKLNEKIENESANLAKGKADKAQAIADYEAAEAEIQQLTNELNEKQSTFDKELAIVEEVILDLEKANSSLDGAIKAMGGAKTAASLVAVRQVVRKHVMLAEALGLADNVKHANAFLQSDNNEYDFKSDGIMQILDNLKAEFSEKLQLTQEEKNKLVNAHNEFKKSNKEATEAANDDKNNAAESRADAEEDIGDATKELTAAQKSLGEDQHYLKDLTASCELKGTTYDQRSTMRTNELKALNKALEIISGGVASNISANKRAFLNQAKVVVKKHVEEFSMDDDVPAFIQTRKLNLRTQRVANVLAGIASAARSLKSVVLMQSYLKLQTAGPFDKVKNLIQGLIERLTKEATEEATQKGYCDMEMGKAKKQRDFRKNDVEKINATLQKQQADKKQNEIDVENLTKELEQLNTDLETATKNRADEKAENIDTLDKAKDGLEAVTMAITVLKNFYKGEHGAGGANTATLTPDGYQGFLQLSSTESPILADEEALGDTPEAGAYQGNQAGGDNVLALLDIIQSDYKRTVRVTTKDEKDAAADFIKFDRETKVAIMSRETEKKNKSNVIANLTKKIKSGFDDLESNVQMMDDQVKILQELNPLCVDTGMTFEERKAKREAEIAALKTALKQLAPPSL